MFEFLNLKVFIIDYLSSCSLSSSICLRIAKPSAVSEIEVFSLMVVLLRNPCVRRFCISLVSSSIATDSSALTESSLTKRAPIAFSFQTVSSIRSASGVRLSNGMGGMGGSINLSLWMKLRCLLMGTLIYRGLCLLCMTYNGS